MILFSKLEALDWFIEHGQEMVLCEANGKRIVVDDYSQARAFFNSRPSLF